MGDRMIIGLTGTMGAGKSAAANLLKEVFFNRPVKIIKFASPLYDMQEYIYRRISKVYTRPNHFVKDRTLLQWLGTDWGRATVGTSIWVDLWKAEATDFLNNNTNGIVICDDVRFNNEGEAMKALGAILIKVVSKESNERNTGPNAIAGHASEAGIDASLLTDTVSNDSTLANLEQDLLKVIRSFGTRRGTEGVTNR